MKTEKKITRGMVVEWNLVNIYTLFRGRTKKAYER